MSEHGIPRYALLDIWIALDGDAAEFEEWMDDPRRTTADAWAQLCCAVAGDPVILEDTNPPCGDFLASLVDVCDCCDYDYDDDELDGLCCAVCFFLYDGEPMEAVAVNGGLSLCYNHHEERLDPNFVENPYLVEKLLEMELEANMSPSARRDLRSLKGES